MVDFISTESLISSSHIIEEMEERCLIHDISYLKRREYSKLFKREFISKCPMCVADERKKQSETEVINMIETGRREYHEKIIKKLFGHSGIPPRFTGKTFDNFIRNEHNQGNINKIMNFADNITDNLDHGRGFIFFGSNGTGKSHLSCALAEVVISKHRSALFISVADMIDDVKAAVNDESSTKKKINKYVAPDLLIIDEIIAGIDEKETKIIAKIINQRYSFKKSTILITNLGLDILAKTIGERITDRLRETNKALMFSGDSFRVQIDIHPALKGEVDVNWN